MVTLGSVVPMPNRQAHDGHKTDHSGGEWLRGEEMIAPQDDLTADPKSVIAELRQQLDARIAERDEALAEKVSLAEALAENRRGW